MYILFTAVLSAFLCFAIIYPLWLFSESKPALYTAVVIFAAVIYIIFRICRTFIRNYRNCTSPESRRKYLMRFIFRLLIILAIILSLIFSVIAVLSENRVLALIIFLCGTALTAVLFRVKARFQDA